MVCASRAVDEGGDSEATDITGADAEEPRETGVDMTHTMQPQRTNKTKQNKTKQNKTKQNKTKQNKTKQNKEMCNEIVNFV
jgi:hypothetical protein